MRVVCPSCGARYVAMRDDVERSSGQAVCMQCNTPFDVIVGRELEPGSVDHKNLLQLQPSDALREHADEEKALPFDIPDDLPPLEPDPNMASESSGARRANRPLRFLAGLIAMLLVVGLVAQFGWLYRDRLLDQFPVLEPICEHLPCRITNGRDTDALRVLKRDILPTANASDSLTLSISFFNAAAFAQPYPDIQLSLQDNSGRTLVRRRLDPGEYLSPAPADNDTIAPGEVVTISVDFIDPGYLATGFIIDFL